MRIREFLDFTPLRVSLVLFAGAVIFALWALIGAFRRPSTDVAMPAGAARVAPLAQIALAAPADIDGAVEQDPFSPDRSAPDEPFHMPGEARASADASGVSSPKPKVLGTAIGPVGESFATAQLGDAVPRIVRVGDKLGSYTVTAIARGRVQFRTPDGDRLDVAAQAASTQETANASIDTTTAFPFPRATPGAGRGFFGGFGAGQGGRRGRRGATPDTTAER